MCNTNKYRLEGSSLIYALTIIILIGSITSSLILLAVQDQEHTRNWLDRLSVSSLSMSGAYASTLEDAPAMEGPSKLNVLSNENQEVLFKKGMWGIFNSMDVRATAGTARHDRSALFGKGEKALPVLWIHGPSNGLNLCGDARVFGNLWTSDDDVRRGYIEGVSYSGDRLIYGEVVEQRDPSPILNRSIAQPALHLCGGRGTSMEQHYLLDELDTSAAHVFSDDRVLNLTGLGRLSEGRFSRVILRSTAPLSIGRSVVLDDVIIQAPFVTVESGAKGKVQVFATEGILLEEDVELSFPSALVLSPADTASAMIDLLERAQVEGMLLVIQDDKDLSTRARLASGAKVVGRVHVQGGLENRGTIEGHAIVNSLTLRTASASYRGYLLDGIFKKPTVPFQLGMGSLESERKPVLIEKNSL